MLAKPLALLADVRATQVSWVRHWEALLAMMFDTLAEELPPHHMVAAHVHGSL
jgi:hypothetical protein